MREILYIVLHCTATSQKTKVQSIIDYWKVVLKWKNPGYHFLIDREGTIQNLHPIHLVANGVRGFNANAIHISYIGGIDKNGAPLDNRSPEQILAQLKLIIEMKKKFPKAKVLGHRDFKGVNKACPSFNTKRWLQAVGF